VSAVLLLTAAPSASFIPTLAPSAALLWPSENTKAVSASQLLYTGHDDGVVRCWALGGGAVVAAVAVSSTEEEEEGGAAQVTALQYHTEQQLLLVGHADGRVSVYHAPRSGVRPPHPTSPIHNTERHRWKSTVQVY
jgi:WD40 repeat protein